MKSLIADVVMLLVVAVLVRVIWGKRVSSARGGASSSSGQRAWTMMRL